MLLQVEIPPPHDLARRHGVELIVRWVLGWDVEIVPSDAPDYRVRIRGTQSSVTVPDVFLKHALSAWLEPTTLPTTSTETWSPPAEVGEVGETARLPAPLPLVFARTSRDATTLPIDVFGAAFFFASRYEEAVTGERDSHDRMPCARSLAARLGVLERPLVHEYAELLFRALRRQAPNLPRTTRSFRVLPSHDIDEAYRWVGVRRRGVARSVAGHLGRRAPLRALRAMREWRRVRRGDLSADPYATYDAIMDESERRGLRSTFFFVADGSTGYAIHAPEVTAVLRRIHARGHEIGLHSAYETYRDAAKARAEMGQLEAGCAQAGVAIAEWANRQHVLRWDPLATPRQLAELGFHYDATLGFAERIGFRTAMCVDHPAFDLAARRPLELLHRPLVVMDATLTEARYLGLAKEPDIVGRAVSACKAHARAHHGDFGVLWHNSRLVDPIDWQLYRAVLDA